MRITLAAGDFNRLLKLWRTGRLTIAGKRNVADLAQRARYVVAAGTYEFSAPMDLATVGTRNFIAAIEASAFDADDTVDDRTAAVDDWDSLDGTVVNDCDATLWIATTADDPAASPTWSAWRPFFVDDFTGRGFKFRLTLESGNPAHNIAISALQVRARTPA